VSVSLKEVLMRTLVVFCFISSLTLAGCSSSRQLESKEAVQKAIEAYLAQRQNLTLSNMNMEVAEVKFEGETATAEVKFQSKQNSSLAVNVHYKLKRRGDKWEVESTTPAAGSGGSPHGGITSPAPGSPHGATPLESSH
jgi:hypothetical protein